MADTLESLEIEVKHSASDAAGEISAVANAISDLHSQLSKALPELKGLASALKDIKGKVNINIQGASATAEGKVTAADMEKVVAGEKEMTFADYAREDIERAKALISSAASVLKKDFEKISSAASKAGKVIKTAFKAITAVPKAAISIAKKGFGRISDAISGLKERAKESIKPLSGLLGSLKRIAFYRIIRGVIKAIAQAIQEGLQNAYGFSAGIDGVSHRFAEAMDSMTAASGIMKNQLGAAFISVLAIIAPIVNAIIGLITRLAAVLSQLFGAFTGGTWLKATDKAQGLADACGGGAAAAKEWKNQLLGFDEINRLEDPGGGGGGGGGALDNFAGMFEEANVDEAIQKFVDDLKAAISKGDWQGAGSLIGEKINELIPPPEKWNEIGTKLGYGLNGAVETLYYTLKTIDFKRIGTDIASFINGALEQINPEVWGAILIRKITMALDFWLGILGTVDWGLVGQTIGELLRGAFGEAAEWLKEQDWKEVGGNLFDAVQGVVEGIDFVALAQSFFSLLGTAFGAAVLLIDGFFSDTIQAIKDYFKEKTEEAGGDAWEGFKNGIKAALANVYEWVKTNVVDPFVDAFKALLGIHSPSTVFEGFGSDIVQGLWNGVTGLWSSFAGWFIREAQALASTISGILATISNAISSASESVGGGAHVSAHSASSHSSIPRHASGGFVEDGLFFANHNELVGQFSNGRTAVANNEQIIAGIERGVYNAMVSAGGGGNSGTRVAVLNVNGREFARAIFEDNRFVANEHGISLINA